MTQNVNPQNVATHPTVIEVETLTDGHAITPHPFVESGLGQPNATIRGCIVCPDCGQSRRSPVHTPDNRAPKVGTQAAVELIARRYGWRPLEPRAGTARAYLLGIAAELDAALATSPGHPSYERHTAEATALREAVATAREAVAAEMASAR